MNKRSKNNVLFCGFFRLKYFSYYYICSVGRHPNPWPAATGQKVGSFFLITGKRPNKHNNSRSWNVGQRNCLNTDICAKAQWKIYEITKIIQRKDELLTPPAHTLLSKYTEYARAYIFGVSLVFSSRN